MRRGEHGRSLQVAVGPDNPNRRFSTDRPPTVSLLAGMAVIALPGLAGWLRKLHPSTESPGKPVTSRPRTVGTSEEGTGKHRPPGNPTRPEPSAAPSPRALAGPALNPSLPAPQPTSTSPSLTLERTPTSEDELLERHGPGGPVVERTGWAAHRRRRGGRCRATVTPMVQGHVPCCSISLFWRRAMAVDARPTAPPPMGARFCFHVRTSQPRRAPVLT